MINITIDGHSGSGKSSTAKKVAEELGFTYIDTGAMYRAVTWAVINNQIDFENEEELNGLLDTIDITFRINEDGSYHTFLNDSDVENQIRSHEVASKVSEVSKIKSVRTKLVEWQRSMANVGGIVMEGRDTGTVVLPDADLKVFMTASLDTRAERRWHEMKSSGKTISLDEIRSNLEHRDTIDSTRDIAPLVVAEGAIEVDTSGMSFEDQVYAVVSLARKKIKEKKY